MDGQRECTIRGNGQNLIDFMYVDDAVDAMLRVVADTAFSGTVDLASRTPGTIDPGVAALARACRPAARAPVTIDAGVAAMARAGGADVTVRHEGDVAEYIEFTSADDTM